MRISRILFVAISLLVICPSLLAQYITVPANDQIRFADNGEIRSLDQAHRIMFRRSENIFEVREYGSIMFSPGAETGNQTAKMFMGSNGNMGIGTTSPRGKLDIWGGALYVTGSDINGTLVAGSQSGNAYLGNDALTNGISISAIGNVGIGTTAPSASYKLEVVGTAKANLIDINNGNADGGRLIFRSAGNPEWRIRNSNGLGFFPGEGQPTSLWLDNSGSVGIGVTDTKSYKFAVNGSAIFTKVVVKQYSSWPDYVFHTNYRLRPLSEVEQYIKQYHHLPEVLSADEVAKEGLDVGDNQATLLKKIEELTLYMIAQDKQIKRLTNENRELETLKKEMEEIKVFLKQIKK